MTFRWTRGRRDLAIALGVGVAIAFSWCLEYRFFGEQRFTDPLSYRGDALLTAAAISAARRGDLLPFASKLMPSLGAPFVASWNDFPITEDWLIFIIGTLGRLVGTIAAINLGYLLACVTAGMAMYFVARRYGLRREGSAIAAFLFGLSNYIFVRTVHHYSLTFVAVVPWNIMVMSWLASRRGLPFKSRRFTIACVATVLTAWGFIYYSFFAAQLYVLGAIAGFARNGWKKMNLKPMLVLAGVFAAALLSVNLDTILYARANGLNQAAIFRAPTDVETYALKPVNFFVPAHLHRFELGREISRRAGEQVVIGGEYPGPYLGVFTGLCLLGLGLFLLVGMARRQKPTVAWGWACTAAWLTMAHSVGGLNSAMGILGFRLFRSVNRVSIVVAALALLFGALVVGRLLRRIKVVPMRWAVLGLVAALAAYEQIPMTDDQNESVPKNRGLADSDRKLVAQMEAALPAGAMIFELPMMHFPEVPPHYGVDSYEMFRPTFYANTLRFSHGDVKGRPNAEWKFRVGGLSPPEMVAQLKQAGFAGIYINRKGFPDGGNGLIQGLLGAGCRMIGVAEIGDSVALAL